MFDYDEKIKILCERKQRYTQEKREVIGYIDSDDSGMILPPPEKRKIVQAISGSGVPVTDVIFNDFEVISNHENGCFYGAKYTGLNFKKLLDMHPTFVDPDSGLLGAYMTSFLSYRTVPWNPDCNYDSLKPLQEKYQLVHAIGALQHLCQDIQIGLNSGWDTILRKIRDCAENNPSQADFYEGLEAVVLGIQGWIHRTAQAAEEQAETEQDEDRRANLLEMAEMNYKMAHEKPETFREACQWVLWYQLAARMYDNSGSLGRLDVALYPYYKKDLEEKRITPEQAVYYLSCYLLRDTGYIQLGGYHPDGTDTTNPVSYLILEAVHKTKIPSNVGVCVGKNVDKGLLRRGVELQFEDKCGNPRFVGVDNLIEGYMKNGYSIELARKRTNSGCHWMSLPGEEYNLQDCIKINLCVVLDVALCELLEQQPQPTMNDIWNAFTKHLQIAVAEIAKSIDYQYHHQTLSFPTLMVDLLCYNVVERGLDCSNGGVDYYNFGVDGSGLAIVADSLASMEELIFRRKCYTFSEYMHFLDTNWDGMAGEAARQRALNCDRYGKGGTRADAYARSVSALFTKLVKEKRTPEGFNMVPGLFSWANTIPMGKTLRATPNGRKAGEPISHGANPNPGFRKDGAATAMSNAIASVQSGYGNTAPMQIELEPSATTEEQGIKTVMALIEDHFQKGGTLINLNVIDAVKVLAANQNPDLYPDLVVRVTGFSAYFASLSPQFRQLVVDRILDKTSG